MFFNSKFAIILFLFLSHCGLEIGEPTSDPFVYRLDNEANLCGVVDYSDELRVYMGHTDYNASNQRVYNILNCLIFKINKYKYSIEGQNQDYLTSDEIKKLIHIFLYDEKKEKYIMDAFVLRPEIFKIKNILIDTIHRHQQNLPPTDQCQANREHLLFRKDIDIFLEFLSDISDVLVSINISSETLFKMIMSMENSHSSLEQNLKTIFENHLWDIASNRFSGMTENELEATISLWSSMISDYSYYAGEHSLQRGHLRYILFNMHIVQKLFDLYDSNNNFLLEKEELNKAFCLFQPIIKFFTADQSFFTQLIFTNQVVFYYTVRYKEIPSALNFEAVKLRFDEILEYKVFNDEGITMSYLDLLEFFAGFNKQLMHKYLGEP